MTLHVWPAHKSGATLPEEVRVSLRGFDATALPYKTGRC